MHKTWIKDGLNEYLSAEHAVWHMPGHKRKVCFDDFLDIVYAHDVTEVPGTDDLYLPVGFIDRSLKQLCEIYHTSGSYYAVNGATGGVFTAIAACTNPGDAVLIARNCHKSVYNAAEVMQLHAEYVQPVWKENTGSKNAFTQYIDGYIDAADVKRILENHPEIRAVVVTSPTYEGVVSDISAISQAAHERGAYVIVDEAHGAHLPFMKPEYSAICMGADIVVQSLHKTLPAMTQTALIHVCTDALVKRVEKKLEVFQTSSPSYIMMMSMESAVCYMADGDFDTYEKTLTAFRQKCKKSGWENIHILDDTEVIASGAYGLDPTRLTYTTDRTGPLVLQLLDHMGAVVCEMAGKNHVVLISTVMDDTDDFQTLFQTIEKVDAVLSKGGDDKKREENTISDLNALVGKKAQMPVYVYPPGSYIVTTGEVFTEDVVNKLRAYQAAGLHIRGL